MKKRNIIIIVISIVVISLLGLFIFLDSNKLKFLGYKDKEIEYIKSELDKNEIDKLIEIPYDENIINILKTKNYKIENMNDYLYNINTYDIDVETAIYCVHNSIDYSLINDF